ncbi:uncharacterized protein LOC128553359 [Mercenaria mercenaria]|uniref:uncharacterized protein LOC128553359 n=1 Tax=Mercenaria mercenaria TaxID=6596 RepID=UPI00234E574E|nr:uncharacterized protein LOC128553359 [Mercenaria mercenaria]
MTLLLQGNMPPKDMLVEIFYAFPNQRRSLFELISERITISNINSVKDTVSFYMHRKNNEMKIVFIYEPKEADKRPCNDFHGYNIEHRGRYEMSAENDQVNEVEANIEQSDFKRIEKCIREHQVKLMEAHTNLMMISPSSVKSSGFHSGGQAIVERQSCIAFYVQYKGYIPIDEDLLPSSLNNIPTDVREGCASFQNYSPCDYIERVMLGSAIYNNAGGRGTLGCFLENDGEILALTSLHVLMEMKSYDALKRNGGRQEFLHGTHCPVSKLPSSDECNCEYSCYQPRKNDERSKNTRLGFLKTAIFDSSSGVEIAIIKLKTDRTPTSGKFPCVKCRFKFPCVECRCIDTESKGLEYTSGKFIDVKELKQRDKVFKVGATSLLTKGTLKDKTTSVKLECGILYNCMKISWDSSAFSKPGDSGAMVFAYSDSTTNETLQSVGIVTCSWPEENPIATIVTPISAIMRVVRQNYKIKSFKSQIQDDKIQKDNHEEVSNTGGSRGPGDTIQKGKHKEMSNTGGSRGPGDTIQKDNLEEVSNTEESRGTGDEDVFIILDDVIQNDKPEELSNTGGPNAPSVYLCCIIL